MSRRILVVDDDRSMVRTLCDIFRLRGWQPDGAYSGEEAVAASRATPYCAVLMDITMPGMDGVAAFKAMKHADPAVAVVLMTAHTEATMIHDAEHSGALRVVAKPIDLPSLLLLLEDSAKNC